MKLGFEVVRQRVGDGVDENQRIADGHRYHVGEVLAVDATAAYAFVQSRAVAFGTLCRADHRVQDFLLPFAFLGGDDAAIHARIETFKFGGFWPVGRRIFESYLRRVE